MPDIIEQIDDVIDDWEHRPYPARWSSKAVTSDGNLWWI